MKKILLIIFSISTVICIFFIYKSNTSITKYVEVKTPFRKTLYSIDENQEFVVDGKIGRLTVEIKNKKVRVKKSSCPNQVCVKTGYIKRSGEIIVCAPNEVTVRILSFRSSFLP